MFYNLDFKQSLSKLYDGNFHLFFGTSLLLASKEGKKGNGISQAEMDQKVEEWLKEK